MKPARSTSLKLVEDHCPKALDFADAGTPYDRDVFATGIAAHACLESFQAVARKQDNAVLFGQADRIAESVAHRLVTEGRSFDGIAEPPLSPLSVSQGREIALRWWKMPRETGAPVPLSWHPEIGLAVNREWEPVAYDAPNAYYRGILDIAGPVVQEAEDEWSAGGIGIGCADYKSAWSTTETELETIQLRGQALLLLAHAGSLGVAVPAFVRRSVINLRTAQTFESDIWLADDDADRTLAGWRDDITLAIAHASPGPDGKRKAAPGACCVGCPYVLRCDAAREFYAGVGIPPSPEALATEFATVEARWDALRALVKEAAGKGSIPVPGGSVGYRETTEREATPAAVPTLAHRWFRPADEPEWDAQNGHTLSLLRAAKLGAGNIKAVATVLHPGKGANKREGWKEDRAALIDDCTNVVTVAKFGVHRTVETEATAQTEEPDGST